MASTLSEFDQLIKKADFILQNGFLYKKSNEFDEFGIMVELLRLNKESWAEHRLRMGKDMAGNPLEDGFEGDANESRFGSVLWEASAKLEDEVTRLSTRRVPAEVRLFSDIVCSSCSLSAQLAVFPHELTDIFHKLTDNFDCELQIDELVKQVDHALKQGQGENRDRLNSLFAKIEAILVECQSIGGGEKSGITLMHRAAFGGLASLLIALTRSSGLHWRWSDINARDSDGQTPLHYATIAEQVDCVKILVRHPELRANEEDVDRHSALQIAVEMKKKEIQKLLLERADVQQYVSRLSADRQVYVDAANAILVGAALIASVTFGGWLQPPLGYTTYYQFPSTDPAAPPDTYRSFVAVDQSMSVRVFWVFNSLSFFCAIATVIAGAGSVLPMPDVFIKAEVREVRKSLVLTCNLLIVSILFVLGAFAAAGFASLPPLMRYETNIIVTVSLGGLLCVAILLWFCWRLFLIRPTWWKRMEDAMFLPRSTRRREQQKYLIS